MTESFKNSLGRRPTISDVAKHAGVSVSTVDRVLNGRHPVRKQRAELVLKAAEELGFYAEGLIRKRLGPDRPPMTLGFLLQQKHRNFFQLVGQALAEKTRSCPSIVGSPKVVFVEDLDPGTVANELLKLGRTVDAVALIAGAHPHLSRAIDTLHEENVPVFGLITELTATRPVGFVGLDNWKVGRTAAWAIANMAPRPGKVGIIVGTHRYRCQEANEMGFRSFFRERASEFTLLEPGVSFEDSKVAAEVLRMMLAKDPDIVGLYVAGGGLAGVADVMREAGGGSGPLVIGHELTTNTRAALLDGTVRLLICHPLPLLAETLVNSMVRGVSEPDLDPMSTVLPFDIFTSENV